MHPGAGCDRIEASFLHWSHIWAASRCGAPRSLQSGSTVTRDRPSRPPGAGPPLLADGYRRPAM